MKGITLLGSTGSIGRNVLEVVRSFPDRYKVIGLAAGYNVNLLAQQILEFEPEMVSVADGEAAAALAEILPGRYQRRIHYGEQGNCLVASCPGASLALSAIVGAAGLLPTLAAIEAGLDIGLANKETLVMAGKLVMDAVREKGVRLLPVDSEHSAIYQALEAGRREDVSKIILTASGGPFLGRSKNELAAVSCKEALAHPNWSMGRKISIDSATLMNKGLEVIEAHWLFNAHGGEIDVVVHPQSIVHSLVEYQDGSVLAQLGIPDMRIPIGYALSYPERMALGLPSLDLVKAASLEFLAPDYEVFPALGLAFEALATGGVAPAVLNAANEVAVAAFLDCQIGFLKIAETVAETMRIVTEGSEDSLADILAADAKARIEAGRIISAIQ